MRRDCGVRLRGCCGGGAALRTRTILPVDVVDHAVAVGVEEAVILCRAAVVQRALRPVRQLRARRARGRASQRAALRSDARAPQRSASAWQRNLPHTQRACGRQRARAAAPAAADAAAHARQRHAPRKRPCTRAAVAPVPRSARRAPLPAPAPPARRNGAAPWRRRSCGGRGCACPSPPHPLLRGPCCASLTSMPRKRR